MNGIESALASVWQPHAGQRAFLENAARLKVLACGRRWGKTDACAAQIVSALLRESPAKVLIIAPTLDQARLLFDRVVEMLEALTLPPAPPLHFVRQSGGGEIGIKIRRSPYPHMRWGRHTVMARSGQLGRSLRGNEATHIVIDEAAFLPEEIITEIAMPMLATTSG